MKNAGRKGGQLTLVEDGAHDAYIIQMARQGPGVIRDKGVAGMVIVGRKPVDEILHPQGHGPRLTGGGKTTLGQFPALPVGKHAGVVMGIPEQARKGRPGDAAIGLIDNGNKSAP